MVNNVELNQRYTCVSPLLRAAFQGEVYKKLDKTCLVEAMVYEPEEEALIMEYGKRFVIKYSDIKKTNN